MTARSQRIVAAGLVVAGFLSEVALTTVANSALALRLPGRQYSGQEIIEMALRTGRGGLLQSALDSFTLLPDQHLVAIGVLLGLALSMVLAASGLAFYAGTAGHPRTWAAWSLLPWPGSFIGLVALTLLPHARQDGASPHATESGNAVADTLSPSPSAGDPGLPFSDGPRTMDRSLALGLVLIPSGLACQLPVLMEVWGPIARTLFGLHPPGAYYLSLWELAVVLLGITLASSGLILVAHARGHHPAWGILGMVPIYGPVVGFPFILTRTKTGTGASLLLALLGILLMLSVTIVPDYLGRPLISWVMAGAFLSGVGLAIFARALGRNLAWGLLGLVPMVLYLVLGPATIAAPVIGLLTLWAWGPSIAPSPRTIVTIPEQGPSAVATREAAKCLSLILSAAVMQWFSWYWEAAPYLPLYLPERMWPALVPGILGLFLWMGQRGRHSAWSLLGLIPVAGPLVGLMIPPGRSNPDGGDGLGRLGQFFRSSTLVLLVASWLVWGLLEWGHGTIVASSVSPNGTARTRILLRPVFIDINFEIQSQRISGIFTDKPRALHYSGDQCGTEGRVLWTKDSARFLLIGPRFCVQKSGELPNGQKLFFMHDLSSGQSWCNNSLTQRCEGQPFFSRADLAGLTWDHPSVLDESAAKPGPATTAPP